MHTTIDQTRLVGDLRRLVGINSVNPRLASDGPGESEAADFVAEVLKEMNLEVQRHEPEPGRTSVVGILRGLGGGRSLMLNAHLDTVGTEGMLRPFNAEVRDGRLYGRGAYDMKGSLAACLAAVRSLVESGVQLAGDLMIAAVADEEHASLGTSDLITRYLVDGAVVAEPSEMEICLAHKGFVWIQVETLGRAYHGSRFDKGIDAIMRMGRFLARLDHLEQELRSRRPHPLVGPPSLHAAVIEGGTAESVYAASCRLKIERRTVPGETLRQVETEVRAIIRQLQDSDPTFKADLSVLMERPPFEGDAECRLTTSLKAACRRVLGTVPPIRGENPWMDSALLAQSGVETVVMGPIGAGAHSNEEWVDLESLNRLAEILAWTALDYCAEP